MLAGTAGAHWSVAAQNGFWTWRTILRARGRCGQDCAARLEGKRAKTLIFSCLRDKPVTEMAQILFPLFDRVILAPIHAARAASMEDLLAAAGSTGTSAVVADSAMQALELAAEGARGSAGEVIVVSGSVYLVGEARSILQSAEGERA